VRSGVDDVHRVSDRCRPAGILWRSERLAIGMVGYQQQAMDQAFHQRIPHHRVPQQAVRSLELTVHHEQADYLLMRTSPVVGLTVRASAAWPVLQPRVEFL
jgi:hypothetical protein